MASIHDVAEYCGVSTATVSRALRGLPNVSSTTRMKVEKAAAELGYIASPSAAALSSGRTGVVAVVVPSLTRWFYAEVVEGVQSVLREAGIDTYLVDLATGPQEREELFSYTLLRRRADGVIALGVGFTPAERVGLQSLAVPTVIVGPPMAGLHSVGVDDAAVSGIALRHLHALGHRDIAHVGGHDDFGLDRTVAELRRRAWSDVMAEQPEHGSHRFASGGFLMPQSKKAALALLAQPDRPTAIFAGSDEMAFGTLLAARELGIRVPEELSVVGVDDHAWSAAFNLTTVRQDPHEQGVTAAELVLREMGGATATPRNIVARGELIVRSTTAPPRRPR